MNLKPSEIEDTEYYTPFYYFLDILQLFFLTTSFRRAAD